MTLGKAVISTDDSGTGICIVKRVKNKNVESLHRNYVKSTRRIRLIKLLLEDGGELGLTSLFPRTAEHINEVGI